MQGLELQDFWGLEFLLMWQVDESEKLSKLATVDLADIFPNKKVLSFNPMR